MENGMPQEVATLFFLANLTFFSCLVIIMMMQKKLPFILAKYYNVGGKIKWYGAALLRFSPHEFAADESFQCLPWPLRAGLMGVSKDTGMAGTAHALGSMVTGDDPATSVVDSNGKVHGLTNLYVGNGSVLPRASRVNPALTCLGAAAGPASRSRDVARRLWARRKLSALIVHLRLKG
jgi:hypothetical protein